MVLRSVLGRSCRLHIDWTGLYRHSYSWQRNCNQTRYQSNIVKSPYPDITLPNIPLHHFIWENVHKWPNHIAIECGVTGKRYSYVELQSRSIRLAASLKKLGLKRGDTIALVLPNIPEFPIAYLGSLEQGLTVTTVNPAYSRNEIRSQLELTNTDWVICDPTSLERVRGARITKEQKVICTDGLNGSRPRDVILFEDLVSSSADERSSVSTSTEMSDVALIAYSSGTTGLPKGTCLTHGSITANIAQYKHLPPKWVETHGDHQDVVLGVLPFFHSYGNIFVLLGAMSYGAKIVSLPKFEPAHFLRFLLNNKNIYLYLVPPLVLYLGNSDDVSERHLDNVKVILVAAAPLSSFDCEKVLKKKKDLDLFQAFGMTEASPLLTLQIHDDRGMNTSTIGKLIPSTWGKVLDPQSGQALGPNQQGELCFKGPQLMKCYLNNAEATAATIDTEGWLHSGDIGYYDDNGYFYITDRLKELIKVKGFQVAPAEVEEVLRKFPGVLEAGVVGVPCDRSGEKPSAFIQIKPGTNISDQDVMDFVASQLSEHKHLSSVRFIDVIPKTPSGKILRRNLKDMVLDEMRSN